MLETEIDILNEPVEQMAEERLALTVKLLRERVAHYEERNAQLAAENDRLRQENDGLK